jgi:hypothetical protein
MECGQGGLECGQDEIERGQIELYRGQIGLECGQIGLECGQIGLDTFKPSGFKYQDFGCSGVRIVRFFCPMGEDLPTESVRWGTDLPPKSAP